MPTKIFTTIPGNCPFGKNVAIDSAACRNCQNYYRMGTAMFFWCKHSTPEIAESTPKLKKRGRPPGKTHRKPVNERKTKKR